MMHPASALFALCALVLADPCAAQSRKDVDPTETERTPISANPARAEPTATQQRGSASESAAGKRAIMPVPRLDDPIPEAPATNPKTLPGDMYEPDKPLPANNRQGKPKPY